MDLPLFFGKIISQGILGLSAEETHHCLKVLRMKTGDGLYVTDGLGLLAEGRIVSIDSKHCFVEIIKELNQALKRNFHLHIAIAPTKNIDRIEWFLEKATEIGICEVSLLLCEHSERRTVKEERLERIMISAIKQSFQAWLPKLNPMVSFHDFIKKDHQGMRLMAHLENPPAPELASLNLTGDQVLILVGPEGDFTEGEILSAKGMGFQPISLGKNRLRTETAGLVACATVNMMNNMHV